MFKKSHLLAPVFALTSLFSSCEKSDLGVSLPYHIAPSSIDSVINTEYALGTSFVTDFDGNNVAFLGQGANRLFWFAENTFDVNNRDLFRLTEWNDTKYNNSLFGDDNLNVVGSYIFANSRTGFDLRLHYPH